MILYFTGTGNSRFAAGILAEELKEAAVPLNDIFKENRAWRFHSDTPFVFVVPIYAWRIPLKIEKLLKKAEFSGSRRIYLVGTMGAHAGLAGEYCRQILERRGLEYMGFAGIRMPDNYVVDYPMPDPKNAARRIRASVPAIRHAAEKIRAGQPFDPVKIKKGDQRLSGPVNWAFNHLMVKFSRFSVSDTCIRCGKCVRQCPVNNIVLKNGKVRFGNHCMFCLACLHQCPAQAIDYHGKAAEHGRYTCPLQAEDWERDADS